MQRRKHGSICALSGSCIALLLGACGSDAGGEPAAATNQQVAEQWDVLARDYGCALGGIDADKLIAKCNALALKWFDCVAKGQTQCLCEADDGSLNCEGSWKPNEGPALCVVEHRAYAECAEP